MDERAYQEAILAVHRDLLAVERRVHQWFRENAGIEVVPS